MTDLHRFMAFDSRYCRHRMTFIFRYSYHRACCTFLTCEDMPDVRSKSLGPGKFEMGECRDSHFGVSIGLVQNLSSARKKGCKTRKKRIALQCNAWHLCAKALASWNSDWNSLMLSACETKGRTQHETSGANAHIVESIHFMWRFFRLGLHDRAALQPLWRRCHNGCKTCNDV